MSQAMIKNRKIKFSHSYAALKSNNELYYQMASIFKQVAETEAPLADRIISGLLVNSLPEISLENTI